MAMALAMEGDSLLPGFRFSPTDEELVAFYLSRKAFRGLSHDHVIGELDIYNFEPWDLPGLAVLKSRDGQWFFFGPRERRRRPGTTRNSRATKSGYWKTTGKDRKVRHGSEEAMGLKKTLVYYKGRTPRGVRTDWVMHEYRINKDYEEARSVQSAFVVCKIFKKGGPGPRNGQQYGAPVPEEEEENEKESSESSEGMNQEEEEALMAPVSDGFEPAPQVNNGILLPDLANTLADELFADLPTLANDLLFPNQYDCQIWPGEGEAMVLAEMLQSATESVENAQREEANGDLLSLYPYYSYSPQHKNFLDVEDSILPQFDDSTIAVELNDVFQIGSLDAASMVQSETQYSFDQPSISSSQVRPEFQCPSLYTSKLPALLIIYFAIICIWIASHTVCLLVESELYESPPGYNLLICMVLCSIPPRVHFLAQAWQCGRFQISRAVSLLFNLLQLSLSLHYMHTCIHTYIHTYIYILLQFHITGEPSHHSSEASRIRHCKQQKHSGLCQYE